MVFTRLKNVGNTCFLNATLQCLIHITELNEWLDKNEPEKVFIKEYNDLRKLMLEGHDGVTPYRFVGAVHHAMPHFKPREQQDAGEFLLYLMDEINCPLFKGEMISHLDTTQTREPFWNIEVPIVSDPCTLESCIIQYFQTELVEWNDKIVPKKYEIVTYPTILIITLKRFTNANKKNNAMVNIPLTLQLNETYDLICICNHSGNTTHGHYTACISSDKWYDVDDEMIMPCAHPITNNAYCLIFRKKTV